MKSYLTGNPEIRLALNEDLSIGREGGSSVYGTLSWSPLSLLCWSMGLLEWLEYSAFSFVFIAIWPSNFWFFFPIFSPFTICQVVNSWSAALSIGYRSSSGSGPVILDDCNFHESVRLDSFDVDRTLSLVSLKAVVELGD